MDNGRSMDTIDDVLSANIDIYKTPTFDTTDESSNKMHYILLDQILSQFILVMWDNQHNIQKDYNTVHDVDNKDSDNRIDHSGNMYVCTS